MLSGRAAVAAIGQALARDVERMTLLTAALIVA